MKVLAFIAVLCIGLLFGDAGSATAWQFPHSGAPMDLPHYGFVKVPYGPYTIYLPLASGGTRYGDVVIPPAPRAPVAPGPPLSRHPGYLVVPPLASSPAPGEDREGGGYVVVPRPH